MKKFLLLGMLLFASQMLWGQNPKIVGEICPGCGVYVRGRHLRSSDHKAGCWWLAQQQEKEAEAEEKSSPAEHKPSWGSLPYSGSGAFRDVEGRPLSNDEYEELLYRTPCDICGGTAVTHRDGCIVGYNVNLWHKAEAAGDKSKATIARDNVVTYMLNSESGMKKIRQMRGLPEPPKADLSIGDALIPRPLAQAAPQFAGRNVQSVVYEYIRTTSEAFEWGEMAERYKDSPIEYDLARWTHNAGTPVILGKRNPEGGVNWNLLLCDKEGKYNVVKFPYETMTPSGAMAALKDIRFEGEGQYLLREYEGGWKIYSTPDGKYIAKGYDVGIAPMMMGGRYLVLENNSYLQSLYKGPGDCISGQELVLFEDAIVVRNDWGQIIYNWDWSMLSLDGIWSFKDIKFFRTDKGASYIIEISNGRFALVNVNFQRIGGIFSSANEALAAWDEYRRK